MMKKAIVTVLCFFCLKGTLLGGTIGEIDIHGFISQGYLKSTENNFFAETKDGTFQFNEMGINFATWVSPALSLGVQFSASDLGDIGNDNVYIDWAYADYRFQHFLNIRAGKIKQPIGLYNEMRDIDSLRTSIFLPSSLYLETAKEPMRAMKGAGIYGYLPFNVSYQFLYGTQEIETNSGIGIMCEQNAPSSLNMEVNTFDVADKICGTIETDIGNLILKGSYTFTDLTINAEAYGTDFSMSNDITFASFSTQYTINNVVLAFEYGQQINEMSSGTLSFLNRKITSEMAYVSASNKFTHWLETGVYYSWMFTDKNKKRENGYEGWFKDTCLSFRFDLNTNWLIKLEGHYFDGTAMMLDYLNPDYKRSWYLFAAKFSYIF